jgi:hypothetical protein
MPETNYADNPGNGSIILFLEHKLWLKDLIAILSILELRSDVSRAY